MSGGGREGMHASSSSYDMQAQARAQAPALVNSLSLSLSLSLSQRLAHAHLAVTTYGDEVLGKADVECGQNLHMGLRVKG